MIFGGAILPARERARSIHDMKKTSLVCCSVLAALLETATACINISGVSMDGTKGTISEQVMFFTREALTSTGKDKGYWEALLAKLEPKMKVASPTTRDRADYGGVLVHLGQLEKARKVLEAAEAAEPGNYAVASNLGTTFELLGDNVKALEWIKKGMERSPSSHGGTEWVHVKILEAKQALAIDPKWLESHSVLDVDYGSAPRPALAGKEARVENRRVMRGAGYQLSERLKFVKAPDPLVGNLLFDLANALAVGGSVETALGVYELAQEYQAPRAALLAQRLTFMRGVMGKALNKASK